MSRHLLLVPASRVLRPCAWWSFGRQVTKVPGPRAGRPWDARLASGQLVGTAYSAGTQAQRDRTQGIPMSVLERSRWQFRIITVYHFIFVPLTIGLSILVACM